MTGGLDQGLLWAAPLHPPLKGGASRGWMGEGGNGFMMWLQKVRGGEQAQALPTTCGYLRERISFAKGEGLRD